MPALVEFGVRFAVGALLITVAAGLVRAALAAALEPQGRRLDRWRRSWFHPERELARLFEALLIVSFVATFARRYELPPWAALLLGGIWALHLPADLWAWWRWRRHPQGTLELHLRGFALLDLGPVRVRVGVALLALITYLLLPHLQQALDALTGFVFSAS